MHTAYSCAISRLLRAMAVCLAMCSADPASASETLLLKISVNDQVLDGIVFAERLDDGRMVLPADAWVQARLKPLSTAQTLPDGRVAYALEAVPGLKYQLDMARLTLVVTAPAEAFESSQRNMDGDGRPVAERPPPGFYLDYDLSTTRTRGGSGYSGALLEAVVFNRSGSLVSGMAWRSGSRGNDAFRTDTYWRRDLPASMRTLVIGDTVSSAGGWSRPVRYAGVRFARDFSTAPGYITYPMPSISGSAALPSTVDVLINNQRSASSEVPPGPFELTNVPMAYGAGQVQLVVRDLLGRETMITQDYYIAQQLLARGLTDFSFEAGKMRVGYGTSKDRYENTFASTAYRRGLNDTFTAGIRVEAERDRKAAGFSLTTVIANMGVVHLATGWSDADGKRGGHYVVAAQHAGPSGGVSASWSRYDDNYREFGALAGEHHPRQLITASAGARLGRRLSGGVSYTRQTDWEGKTFSLAGANAGMQVGKSSYLSANASRRMDDNHAWTVMVNLIIPLGERRSITAGSTRQYNGKIANTLQAINSPPPGPGWGWRVSVSDTPNQQLQADMVLNRNTAQFTMETSLGDNNGAVRLGMNGAIGRLKGLGFASRHINHGAFAVVRVGDIAGAEVSLSNQVLARTNSKGLALVTGLLPYQSNKLSLDPDSLPLEAEIGGVHATSIPYARSGAYIEFPVIRSRSALVVLTQTDGSPVPAGARVTLGPGLAEFTVALRGEVYLTDIADENQLDVHWTNGACKVTLRIDALSAGPIATTSLICGVTK